MSTSSRVVFACSVALAIAIANCVSSSPTDRFANTDTLTVLARGHKIEIPRFKPSQVRLSDERYAFDKKIVETLKEEVISLTREVLIKNTGWIYLSRSLGALGMKLRKIAKENAHLKQVDTSVRLNSGLGVTNGVMLDNMVALGKGEKLEAVTAEEAQERVAVLMEAIEKLTAASNTGLVLEYPKMKVDGRSLEDYLKPSVQMLLRKNMLMSGTIRLAALLLRRTRDLPDSVRAKGIKGASVSEAEDDDDLFEDLAPPSSSNQ